MCIGGAKVHSATIVYESKNRTTRRQTKRQARRQARRQTRRQARRMQARMQARMHKRQSHIFSKFTITAVLFGAK